MIQQSQASFPATRWSLIDALAQDDASQREQAMHVLAASYWPAIYAYLRRSGKGREQAVELTQAFFVDVVLERRLFQQADSKRGPLRALLLISLKRFLIDMHRRCTSSIRLEYMRLEDLTAEENLQIEQAELPPDELFDRNNRRRIQSQTHPPEASAHSLSPFMTTGRPLGPKNYP